MKNSKYLSVQLFKLGIALFSLVLLTSCSNAYYDLMEKFGIHKRDILVERVEKTQDAQDDAQEEFKSALDHFASVVTVENTDLKNVYERLNAEYEDCIDAAGKVSARIESIESVSNALFLEWEQELGMYQNAALRQRSILQLQKTKQQYEGMVSLMYQAENSMTDVLFILRDNVIFLKHNLNAQAIGALRNEVSSLQIEVDQLIQQMRRSIASSNAFIEEMRSYSP